MFCENCKKEIPFLSEMVACPFCKTDIKKRDVVADLSDLVARYGSDAVLDAIKSLNVVKQEELSSLTLLESKNDEVHGTFTDPRDGQVYKTVKIGDQVWFAENLRYETNNHDSCVYGGNYKYFDRMGLLYSKSVLGSVVPKGWHIPSKEEWEKLFQFVLKDSRAKDIFPLLAAKDWFSFDPTDSNDFYRNEFESHGGTLSDKYGFDMVPGGHRYSFDENRPTGSCYRIGREADFWIAAGTSFLFLHVNEDQYRIRSYDKNYSNYSPNDAYSIRLVKDKW